MTRSLILLVGLACIAGLALVASHSEAREPGATPPRVRLDRDVEFGRAGDEVLTMNLARPAAAADKQHPCVVVIHGGGWVAGRKERHDSLVRVLAEEGFVAATIEYRLCPGCPWPAQIEDAKAAVRYLRKNAKTYGVDPNRIAALGFSAGAHLAMLLGTMDPKDGLEFAGADTSISSKVQAVVAFFGPTDMDHYLDAPTSEVERRIKRETLTRLLGAEFAKDVSRMSPTRYVDSKDAPMLIFQGTRDRLVPYEQALRMMDRLHEAEIAAEVTFLVGAGHGWRDPLLSATVQQTQHFLDRQFRPERVASFAKRLRIGGK